MCHIQLQLKNNSYTYDTWLRTDATPLSTNATRKMPHWFQKGNSYF